MLDDRIEFIWNVPQSCYWVSGVGLRAMSQGNLKESQRFLTLAGNEYNSRRYDPRAVTGMFHIFATTEPTEAAILGFVKKFGLLGATDFVNGTVAEPLDVWVAEIEAMREMVTLWNTIKQNPRELANCISWPSTTRVVYSSVKGRELIASEQSPELLSFFPKGDLVGPAVMLLMKRINDKLVDHNVVGRLLWPRPSTGSTTRDATVKLHIVPPNLLSFMYLQFARAVEGNKNFRPCENCRQWFEIGGQAARTDKRFCTPTCKSSAYQKKQRKLGHQENSERVD